MLKLLSSATANMKTMKGTKKGYMTYPLHLSPSNVSGVLNTCPKATQGCIAACLNTAGRGGMFKAGESTNSVQEARIRKTKMFVSDRQAFLLQLKSDIEFAIRQATKKHMIPVFRLNCTSDLSWEKYIIEDGKNIFDLFPDVQFYDYTKVLNRKVKGIKNYHLTFSRAESNDDDVNKAIAQGYNIAVVFDAVPTEWNNTPVFDADDTDLRFLDPANHIIGLKAKGRAKKDTSGFVIKLK